jgi:hypothetical protein
VRRKIEGQIEAAESSWTEVVCKICIDSSRNRKPVFEKERLPNEEFALKKDSICS